MGHTYNALISPTVRSSVCLLDEYILAVLTYLGLKCFIDRLRGLSCNRNRNFHFVFKKISDLVYLILTAGTLTLFIKMCFRSDSIFCGIVLASSIA